MSDIRIIEVSPRDGLQNEKVVVPTEQKAELVRNLLGAGLTEIEVSSFVSPKWVPQLGDIEDLWPMLPPSGIYSALVPNERGLERAKALGVERIALFTAASDAFTQKNINMTVDESLEVFARIRQEFKGFVRGYVSTIFECPYAGLIEPKKVREVVDRLFEIGVDEVSLGDTIGVGVPHEVQKLADELNGVPKEKVVWHFHDTRGTAIANVAATLDLGYTSFDSSAAGLGGCPYAKGAGGNLATEDLVYFAERSGLKTGVDWQRLAQATLPVLKTLQKAPTAKAQLAALASLSH
ncbi:MAG: hydroxymethylglutaryl-CoA lyase [Armatimonadetes bacterium]|nr:hydroxymethylglutaryl-CoA lyase [Armatimonadota bacterium]MBS1728722.1 hydroxymethylglutaryl-CoA lyase [Armatimonadota bacterium]